MKVLTLLSIAAATFTFSTYVQASNIPDPSVHINTCLASAKTPAETHRCYALDNCNKNQSSGEEQLRECWFQAEETYRVEAGAPDAPYHGYGAPVPEINSPVSTEAADSEYHIKGGDSKGWRNATQGD